MNIAQIISERRAGFLKIESKHIYDANIAAAVNSLGYAVGADCLTECDVQYAVDVIKTMLWKDLAYSIELIKEDAAITRAEYLISQFANSESTFFVNGDFKDYHTSSSSDFTPITTATFNAARLCFLNRLN